MAFRPKILALANKITLEAHTGIPNVPSDPEYRILAEGVTDEQVYPEEYLKYANLDTIAVIK